MKVFSWNVNGLRSVIGKGFLEWIQLTKPEILCLQEIKLQENQLPKEVSRLSGYQQFFNFADKKGYGGVAVFSKLNPKNISNKLGLKRFDQEGRFLKLDFGNFSLINIYLPHGGRAKENLEYKLEVYKLFLESLRGLKNQNLVLIGDFNIAHQEIDLARPKENKNNIMFTPEERKQIDNLLNLGFQDSFRKFHPGKAGHYTWWPYFANARQRNLGWRIDYSFFSNPLRPKVKDAFILPEIKGSDHCPIGIEIDN